jgi:hypothetical protein
VNGRGFNSHSLQYTPVYISFSKNPIFLETIHLYREMESGDRCAYAFVNSDIV